MAEDKVLSQEEIELLMSNQSQDTVEDKSENSTKNLAMASPELEFGKLLSEEIDALGEVGNISMGAAATTLSELLNHRVAITSPQVKVITKKQLLETFTVPYMVIKVEFTAGLKGFNMLMLKVADALVIADLMMGGTGKPEATELSEMEISATSEAMNMMIGASSTSLSQLFSKPVNISTPTALVFNEDKTDISKLLLPADDASELVIVSFQMTIGDLVDTKIMQIMGVETAKNKAAELLKGLDNSEAENIKVENINEQSQPEVTSNNSTEQIVPRNLDLILDVPLKVSVILGRTRRPIKEVLNIGPGSLVELESMVNEPVEILVNGMLIAEGEVVVVNENFGVKVTSIISPTERIKRLTS
ncbi:MAG: flagellar motor switch phosphatase FliY [Desulfotomaculum sp.]|nr:flagellar motor switch phosphatase FliY [Desulfotomaculum sp.]